MAIDPSSNAPVVHKVSQASDKQSIAILKSIDESLADIPALKIIMQGDRKNARSMETLGEELEKFRKSVAMSMSTSGLSKEDAQFRIDERVRLAKRQQSDIKDAIQELKKSILGQDVISEADKSVINSLNKIQVDFAEEKESSREQTSWLKDTLFPELKDGLEKLRDGVITGLLGPMNLIIQPIEDLFGFKLQDTFSALFNLDDADKKKQANRHFIKPRRSDMLKYNPEAVYLVDALKGKKGGGLGEEEPTGWLGSLAKMGASLLPGLLKLTSLAAIAGGIIMGIFDGLEQAGNAEKWGTSKVAAFAAGFISGDGEDWKKNAAKWALIGGGVGLMFGPAGAIAGALLGGAFGAIMSAIGPEKVAKALDGIGKWFMGWDGAGTVAGAIPGALLGLKFGGPIGAVAGGILGAGLGTIMKYISKGVAVEDLWKYLIGDPTFMGLAGAGIGGAIGMAVFGPIGLIAGILLGGAVGAVTGMILDPQGKMKSKVAKQVSTALDEIDKSFAKRIALASDELEKTRKLGEGSSEFKAASKKFDSLISEKNNAAKMALNISEDIYSAYDFVVDEYGGKQTMVSRSKGIADKKTWEAFASKLTESGLSFADISKLPEDKLSKAFKQFMDDKAISVDDAIIHPSGKFFIPSPDDTIIATKSPVEARPFDKDMDIDLMAIQKSIELSSSNKEIVTAIKELIAVTKEKKLTVALPPSSNINFSALRTVY